jgi:hypothetical protein
MAKMTRYGYVPSPEDVSAEGTYKPDSNVSGQRFESDGNGGGILYVRRLVMKPGFRKPTETWFKLHKSPMVLPATESL